MADEQKSDGAEKPQRVSLDEQIDQQIRQALGFMVRGILISAPGLPADAIAKSISRVVGELVGRCVVGDLTAVLTVRRECKDAFSTQLGKMPIMPVPGEPFQKPN